MIIIPVIAQCNSQESFGKKRVSENFKIEGITKIIIRASRAKEAQLKRVSKGTSLIISGIPSGGAKGYHSPDPGWKETPAAKWGLSFKSKKYGNVLVISTVNEIYYIHHYYYLSDLLIKVPEGIKVELKDRELTGSGEADLNKP